MTTSEKVTTTGSEPRLLYIVVGSQPDIAFVEVYEVHHETPQTYVCGCRGGTRAIRKHKQPIFWTVVEAVQHIRNWTAEVKKQLEGRAARLDMNREIPLHRIPVTPYQRPENFQLE
jgi:hypothetical protein